MSGKEFLYFLKKQYNSNRNTEGSTNSRIYGKEISNVVKRIII